MPTSLPVAIGIGDLRQVVLVDYLSQIYAVCLQAGNKVVLHKNGAGLAELIELDSLTGGPEVSKDRLSAAIKGDLLHLMWGTGAFVYHARWNMRLEEIDKLASAAFAGSRPSIGFGIAGNRLVAHYVSATGTHEARISVDDGTSWQAPTTIDSGTIGVITNVDVQLSPLSDNIAAWTNSQEP